MSIVKSADLLAWATEEAETRRRETAEAKSLNELAAVKRQQAKRRIKSRLSHAEIKAAMAMAERVKL